MHFTRYIGLVALGLAGSVRAEDILMHEDLQEIEYERTLALGYTGRLT
jgi:hypothetical protein